MEERCSCCCSQLLPCKAQRRFKRLPPPRPPPQPNPLPEPHSYVVPGNYAVASIDLPAQTAKGAFTGKIHVPTCPATGPATNCVPGQASNVNIVAAYLYWEMINIDPDATSVKFQGVPVTNPQIAAAVQRSNQALSQLTNGGACYSSGTPLIMTMFRADVRKLLPLQYDVNNRPTGKRLVGDDDLMKNGYLSGLSVETFGRRNGECSSAGCRFLAVHRLRLRRPGPDNSAEEGRRVREPEERARCSGERCGARLHSEGPQHSHDADVRGYLQVSGRRWRDGDDDRGERAEEYAREHFLQGHTGCSSHTGPSRGLRKGSRR